MCLWRGIQKSRFHIFYYFYMCLMLKFYIFLTNALYCVIYEM